MSLVSLSSPQPGVTLLTLNRPDRLNALSDAMVAELGGVLSRVGEDPACRLVILTGAGRAFCAGLDLHDYTPGGSPDPASRFARQQRIVGLVTGLRKLRQPVIAAVNGAAAGGGMGLALGADIRVVSESAAFHLSFPGIGLSGCDMGVSWLLPRLIGAGRAFEVLLTGRPILADEALQIGLASAVTSGEELLPAALGIADRILCYDGFGVHMTKEVMWDQLETPSLSVGVDLENRTQIMATFGPAHDVAVQAFSS